MLARSLTLPEPATDTFFLWGPRQVGKSTLLTASYPDARTIDLLRTEEFVRYLHHPELLRDELRDAKPGTLTIIDEVQKVPALLDEVHWLIENRRLHFALCGSSARKVRRGHANLLGGRALRYRLFGLVSDELGRDFELVHMANVGTLPRHYLVDRPGRRMQAYVEDYLREEIAAEAHVRNIATFTDFLRTAAIGDTEQVNYQNIARECGISSPTVKEHYQILVDTLLGDFLPAYTHRQKRRVILAPKFYFADVGVVNHLARRGALAPGSELFGKALENVIHHELQAYRQYRERTWDLSYWRLASGQEVDFVVGDAEVAIEVKSITRAATQHLVGLGAFGEDQPRCKRRVLVCLEPRRRVLESGIEVLPVATFLKELWAGGIA